MFNDTRALFKGLFPKAEITPELARVYREVLAPLDQDTLQQALRNLVATTTNWTPRIPQIMDAYQDERARRMPKRKESWQHHSEQMRQWEEEAARDDVAMREELSALPIDYLRTLEIYLNADRKGAIKSWSRMAIGLTWAAHRKLMPV
jgi:hypothetical protein